MERIRVIGLALVAAFAFSAIGAAAAQAELPEYSVPGAFPKEFLSAVTGEGKLVTVGGREIKCANGGAGEGKIVNAKEANKTVVRFKGCTAKGPFGEKVPCKSTGAATEEIVTKLLDSLLVYLKLLEKPVGVVLLPEESGGLFAEFKCEAGLVKETIKVKGTTIGEVDSALNTKAKEQKLEFEQSGGKQKWLKYFEGDTEVTPEVNLTKGEGSEAFGYEESAVSSVNLTVQTLETGEEWEIKG
jgi:hypothetical protein